MSDFDTIIPNVKEYSFTGGTREVPVEFCDFIRLRTPDQLAKLVSVCKAASFGRGKEKVVDPSYRKALKLEESKFVTPFRLASTGILQRVQRDLPDNDMTLTRYVRAELYKLTVYGKFIIQLASTP
ncbi:hypothetical protein Moror_14658 [Moniliophthora roreri MCA 2997]|uniref:Uncharacterized protein n=1 Tax=Moniliophthora roreri (strain MCA 2997) TaxID=1381753 RepID=V2WKK3_MONRO|nr:hypothetical protein Moror_14658 [Moniliophthora roreri MCA 2997]